MEASIFDVDNKASPHQSQELRQSNERLSAYQVGATKQSETILSHKMEVSANAKQMRDHRYKSHKSTQQVIRMKDKMAAADPLIEQIIKEKMNRKH